MGDSDMNKNIQSFLAIREQRFEKLTADYEKIIREAIDEHGSMQALSRALGEDEKFVWKVLNKRGFKTLRQAALRVGKL